MAFLSPGDPAPLFVAPAHTNPRYSFGSVAGRYVLLGFAPEAAEGAAAVDRALAAVDEMLGDDLCPAFVLTRDPALFKARPDRRGVRWMFDPEGRISRRYDARTEAGEDRPHWLLLDPALRVIVSGPWEPEALAAAVRALPPADDHAGVPLSAPVLIVPRVFEPEFCRRLIDVYAATGGEPSGVMRQVDGRTVGVLDDFKRRRDALILDEGLVAEFRGLISRRLVPEIQKAFQFRATRIERYIVACYDAEDGGYFRPHRDNVTSGTAHRRFAVSINLNAEAFEGGDLRFPEFGSRTYRPPTGGAVVFSCSLLHEATPVTRGRRYATLPFLYDEAGEELRLKNLHLVEKAAGGGATAQA